MTDGRGEHYADPMAMAEDPTNAGLRTAMRLLIRVDRRIADNHYLSGVSEQGLPHGQPNSPILLGCARTQGGKHLEGETPRNNA